MSIHMNIYIYIYIYVYIYIYINICNMLYETVIRNVYTKRLYETVLCVAWTGRFNETVKRGGFNIPADANRVRQDFGKHAARLTVSHVYKILENIHE